VLACSAVDGAGLYLAAAANNTVNQSLLYGCTATEMAAWELRGGRSHGENVNSSSNICAARESDMHFWDGCVGSLAFVNFVGGEGGAIFGPYCETSGGRVYDRLNFVGNRAGSYGIVVLWNGQHTIANSVFSNNTAEKISVLGSGSSGSLVFDRCSFFDAASTSLGSYTGCLGRDSLSVLSTNAVFLRVDDRCPPQFYPFQFNSAPKVKSRSSFISFSILVLSSISSRFF
jgi:hypothetical protein